MLQPRSRGVAASVRAVGADVAERSGLGFIASAMACHACAGTGRCSSYRLRLVCRRRICANSGSCDRRIAVTSRMRATGRWSSLSGPKCAFRKQLDLGAQAAFARGDVQQFEEGAVAHHDLPRERVSLGQQAGEIAAQQDLVRRAQIHEPGLQVVRVRRQNRVAEDPAARIRLRRGALPSLDGRRGHARVAPGEAGRCRDHHASAHDPNEGATFHAHVTGHCDARSTKCATRARARHHAPARHPRLWSNAPTPVVVPVSPSVSGGGASAMGKSHAHRNCASRRDV